MLEAKMRDAAKVACGDHLSGSVIHKIYTSLVHSNITSSQLLKLGIILKAFGSLPER